MSVWHHELAWPAWSVSWYATLCCVAAIDLIAFSAALTLLKVSEDVVVRTYQRTLRSLSACYVFVCVYRCIFPVQYPQRFVWWDTPMSSILVIRLMATIGELCFVAQIALALSFCEHEIHCITRQRWRHYFTQTVALVMVVLIVVAETCSNYATATQNYLGNVLEESCWGVAFSIASPAFFLLTTSCQKLSEPVQHSSWWQRAFGVSGLGLSFGIGSLAYAVYMWAVDVPTYTRLYRMQLEQDFHFQPLLHGIWNAATERNQTREEENWHYAVVWQTFYFSLAVWASILLISAPRLRLRKDKTEWRKTESDSSGGTIASSQSDQHSMGSAV